MSDTIFKKANADQSTTDKLFNRMVLAIMDSGATENEALQVMGRLMVATSMSMGMQEMSLAFKNQSSIDIAIPDEVMDNCDLQGYRNIFAKDTTTEDELSVPTSVTYLHQYPDTVQ